MMLNFFALLTSSCFAILPVEIFTSKVVQSILIGTLTLYVALKTMSSPLSSVLPVARLNKPLIFPAKLTLCMSECDFLVL